MIVRTTAELRKVIAGNPFAGRPEVEPNRLLVVFMASAPARQARERVLAMPCEPEELHIKGREFTFTIPTGWRARRFLWRGSRSCWQHRARGGTGIRSISCWLWRRCWRVENSAVSATSKFLMQAPLHLLHPGRSPQRHIRGSWLGQRFRWRGGLDCRSMIPTLEWTADGVRFLDQTRLPLEETYVLATTSDQVAKVITTMVVRGAPAIGVAAAMGFALGVKNSSATTIAALTGEMEGIAKTLAATRPTAVNLFWAIERMRRRFFALAAQPGVTLDAIKAGLVEEARIMYDEDIAACRTMGAYGASLMPASGGVLTHCNAGLSPPAVMAWRWE